jgi:hypothetical protein
MRMGDVSTSVASAGNDMIGRPALRIVGTSILELNLTNVAESVARPLGSFLLTRTHPCILTPWPDLSKQSYASEALLRRHCGPQHLRVTECPRWYVLVRTAP